MQNGRYTFVLTTLVVFLFLTLTSNTNASDTIQKPHTFLPGMPAKASEVNENFDILFKKLNTLTTEVKELRASTFNCITVNTLKEAYQFAHEYFMDFPSAKITKDALLNRGLKVDEGIDLIIKNGEMATLSMSALHVNTGKIYLINNEGKITPEDDFSNLANAYISLLAGQWLKSYNSIATAQLKNAYTAAQAFFIDYPASSLTMTGLQQAGYRPDENVKITIYAGNQSDLLISAIHKQGNTIYISDWDGDIINENKDISDKIIVDLNNAYIAAQVFFVDNPSASVTYNDLVSYGYQSSEGVTLTIVNGIQNNLLVKGTHNLGNNNYEMNHEGIISFD